jgi:purine-binding chemotaxis protein CheW
VHGAPPQVSGLAALRSRVLTVIDMECRIYGRSPQRAPRPLAVVAEIGGHTYGMLIETVHDICNTPEPPYPIHGRINPEWLSFAKQMVRLEGRSHLLVSLSDFVQTATSTSIAA